jgi:hypothetical protein
VIGQRSPAGVLRAGVDVEKSISSDHGALRIRPLVQPGWGRAGLAYGPYRRENGLAFAVHLLNGHNTSQAGDLTESLLQRFKNWAKGSETDPLVTRLWRWLGSGNVSRTLRKFHQWYWIDRQHRRGRLAPLDENLAVGWFGGESPADPLGEGHAFVIHALGPENGELWAGVGERGMSLLRGLKNVPLYFVIVLRQRGAAYYAATLPNVPGLGAHPFLRPLAIDPFQADESVFAGLHQSVMGQIGFRADTRVYSAQVAQVASLAHWYGSACAADMLLGEGNLDGSDAEVGGHWQVLAGSFARTPRGVCPTRAGSLAWLELGAPAGLIHLLIEAGQAESSVELLFRMQDAANGWRLWLAPQGCSLTIGQAGNWQTVKAADGHGLRLGQVNSIQILDDGEQFGLYLNGEALWGEPMRAGHFGQATGFGFGTPAQSQGVCLRAFEAHPRQLPLPPELTFNPAQIDPGNCLEIADDFRAVPGDLADRITPVGGQRWQKQLGRGVIEAGGDSAARVRASARQPNPGRTAYTVAWPETDFADLAVKITPPGTERGQWEKGRGGLIFWQDARNYFIVSTWLDDYYEGASISTFFYFNGFEDIYDAVWTNVGKAVTWGQPYRLRVVFDHDLFCAYLDEQPVLYRALTDVYPDFAGLQVRRVGLAVNWEWGDDTGSLFQDFVAKGRK